MATSNFYSPLRYPGGKGKVANYVKSLLTINDLEDCTYFEPYAGGAAVALELLFHEYAKTIHINDIDPGVAAFWRSTLYRTEELCQKISATRVCITEWHKQREIYKKDCGDDIELGFATFFLNRTNRSGIIRAGVIGGLAQEGDWKLDARFNKRELIDRISRIGSQASRIKFTQMDALELLKQVPNSQDVFVYLDPPYFHKGKDLYTHAYEAGDHKSIADLVKQISSARWIVSYDDAEAIGKLYGRFRSIHYTLSYSAQSRYKGAEVMFFSPGLRIAPLIMPMHAIETVKAA
jgi:DNA adenine methylase